MDLLHRFAHILIDPFLHLVLTALLGCWLYFRERKRTAQWCWYYSIGALFIVSTSPVPELLVLQRESQYGVLAAEQLSTVSNDSTHVLVLGAGHLVNPQYKSHDRLYPTALKRLVEGITLQRQLAGAKLILCGDVSRGLETQAELLAQTAISLGVTPQDTFLLPDASNTQQEAAFYSNRFEQGTTLLLVTSALHMPRAMYWFEQQGLHPIAAPTDHLIMTDAKHLLANWGPSTRKMRLMESVLHEYAGGLQARIINWWQSD